MLQIPTEQELHDQYREMRLKIIWGACREYTPQIWTFSGDFDRHLHSNTKKLDTVILKLNVLLDEIHFDGEKVVQIPSIEHLTDGLFAAMAKIGQTLVFSIDLLRDDNFVKILLENKSRFSRLFIWYLDKNLIKELDVARLRGTKKWSFKPKYKATSTDLKKEFSRRLDNSYLPIFGAGFGLLLCLVTCPLGALMICGGLILLPTDAIVTGIHYSILKRREKLQ